MVSLKFDFKLKFTFFILLVLMFSTFTGCTKKESLQTTSNIISVKDLVNKIGQTVDISAMRESNPDKLKKLFDISTDDIEESIFYLAPTNMKSDELLIIKLKDIKNKDEVINKIKNRNKNQADVFKSYAPLEYELLTKHILKNNGVIILYSVSSDNEKIEKVFDEYK